MKHKNIIPFVAQGLGVQSLDAQAIKLVKIYSNGLPKRITYSLETPVYPKKQNENTKPAIKNTPLLYLSNKIFTEINLSTSIKSPMSKSRLNFRNHHRKLLSGIENPEFELKTHDDQKMINTINNSPQNNTSKTSDHISTKKSVTLNNNKSLSIRNYRKIIKENNEVKDNIHAISKSKNNNKIMKKNEQNITTSDRIKRISSNNLDLQIKGLFEKIQNIGQKGKLQRSKKHVKFNICDQVMEY